MSEHDDRTVNEGPEDPDTEDPDSAEVRRALADARGAEPIPADVQIRLEAVLAQLSAERPESVLPESVLPESAQPTESLGDSATPSQVVVDLSSRRRRRARNLLIAAAAVTVIGVGAAQLQSGMPGGTDTASESAADDSGGGDSDAGEPGAAELDEGRANAEEAAPEAPSDPANTYAVPPTVRPGNFPADARAIRDQAARADLTGLAPLDPNCLAGTELTADLIQQAQSIPVRYGELDAVLILAKERNGSQEATLYVCGESSPRRTTSLSPR